MNAWRTLGRTGFKVSDVSIGNGASDSNVIRYAYDHGINYIDTAEEYGNGNHEKLIGEALKHMDRSKVFITTKLELKEGDTEQTILDRYGKCLERLGTEHFDALFMHSVYYAETTKNVGFHAAYKKLKADSKVRFCGLSCHGPHEEKQDSMEKVLGAAIEDGRFDLMLMSYNFMNFEEPERVLALAKAKNVGVTAMKTAPGGSELPDFDPEKPDWRVSRLYRKDGEAGHVPGGGDPGDRGLDRRFEGCVRKNRALPRKVRCHRPHRVARHRHQVGTSERRYAHRLRQHERLRAGGAIRGPFRVRN